VGVANTGTDEANHFIQMAGPWMRPGYLPPVLDLESGDTARTANSMAQFSVDFADRIYQVMGIRPAIYINGNYAGILQSATVPSPALVVTNIPNLWSARWPNQTNPAAIDVQNSQPKDTYTPIYGPWDDSPNPVHPWKFWQYASTAKVNAIGNGAANCDVDVVQGGVQFLKDNLIPAVWMNNSSGLWTALSNWNSGQTPTAPVISAGQLTPVGTQTLPIARLPGSNDTVILDRPGTNITVTLNSGNHNIRKLYVREALNISGSSLTINYVPSSDSTSNSAEFYAAVTMGGSESLSVHTLMVDIGQTFTINDGALTFNTINLRPSIAAAPAKLALGGDISINALNPPTATIAATGTLGPPSIDLLGGVRGLFVNSGTELVLSVPISNGGLNATGLGTMRLMSASTYAGGTTVTQGKLLVNNASGSGTGSGAVTVNGGTLGGTGAISGTVTINSFGTMAPGPGSSIGSFTLSTPPVFNGTNFMKIDRNGGTSLADKLVVTSGVLNYAGTLVVSNAGAALTGGEVFTNFSASSYAGSFASTKLPTLAGGLNWDLGELSVKGSIKVNRQPLAGHPAFTRTSGTQTQISFASLLAFASDADNDSIAISTINLTTTNGITLITNGTSIIYSNNSIVPDRFTYTVSDGHGGVATGTANISPMPAAQFGSPPTVGANSVTVHFTGGSNSVYYLDRSTNLPVWVTISTNTISGNGSLDFVDDFNDLSGPPSAAFYRLRW
jgi:autotransporter-associated beta strand protein